MRGGRIAIAAVAVALAGLVFAGGARACSCVPTPPSESLAESDAAVVGRLLSVQPRSATRAVYRYEVLRVYRGRAAIERGETLKVLSSRSSASCGLPEGVGRRFGLFLLRQGGRWTGGLCGVISPQRLRAAAQGNGGPRASCAS